MPPKSKKSSKESIEKKPLEGIQLQLATILDECQRTFACHKKNIKVLRTIQKDDPEKFMQTIVPFINKLLVVFKREASVERLIQFILAFVNSKSEKNPDTLAEEFGMCLVSYLIEYTNVKDKAVRFRACQLIAGIVNCLSEQSELDNELWEDLLEKMVYRTRDKVPIIRMHAVHALARLQDPSDSEDVVIKEYLRMIVSDSSPDVRKAVLSNIGLSKITLPAILERTRDVKEDVRKHAFDVLAAKVSVKVLTIAQRIELVSQGLYDRSEKVRNACYEMLSKWLASQSNNVMKLLACFDVEEFESSSEQALKEILRKEIMNKAKEPKNGLDLLEEKQPIASVIIDSPLKFDKDNLTPEQAFYWRVYASVLKEKDLKNEYTQEILDTEVLPEISKVCHLIQKYSSDDFVCRQLLQLCHYLDYTDEAGRRNLSALLCDMLSTLTLAEETVPHIMDALRVIHPSENEFLHVTFKSMEAVREPLEALETEENKKAIQEAEETLDRMLDDLEELQKKRNSMQKQKKIAAEELKKIDEEIEALEAAAAKLEEEEEFRQNFQEQVQFRCLAITEQVLKYTARSIQDGMIGSLKEEIIAPFLIHENPLLRDSAVKCLGLYSLLSLKEAQKNLEQFVTILEEDEHVEIKMDAMKALFDLLLLFGNALFKKPEPKSEETELEPASPSNAVPEQLEKILGNLSEFVWHEDRSVRTVAVEGFSKLFMHNIACDSKILSSLVLMFFNPDTEEDTRLRQCLSVFFPVYSMSTEAHHQCVEDSFIPTIRAILDAPRSSPLSEIPVAAAAQFVLYHASSFYIHQTPAKEGQDENATEPAAALASTHEKFALALCKEILTDPASAESKSLIRMLNALHLTSNNQECIKKLRVLTDDITAQVKDKVILKVLQKFAGTLSSLDATPSEALSEDTLLQLKEDAEHVKVERAQELDAQPKPKRGKAKAAKKAQPKATKGKANKKKSQELSDEEDELSLGSDIEEVPAKRVTRAKASKKPVAESPVPPAKHSVESDIMELQDSDKENRSPEVAKKQLQPAVASEDEAEVEPELPEELEASFHHNESDDDYSEIYDESDISSSESESEQESEEEEVKPKRGKGKNTNAKTKATKTKKEKEPPKASKKSTKKVESDDDLELEFEEEEEQPKRLRIKKQRDSQSKPEPQAVEPKKAAPLKEIPVQPVQPIVEPVPQKKEAPQPAAPKEAPKQEVEQKAPSKAVVPEKPAVPAQPQPKPTAAPKDKPAEKPATATQPQAKVTTVDKKPAVEKKEQKPVTPPAEPAKQVVQVAQPTQSSAPEPKKVSPSTTGVAPKPAVSAKKVSPTTAAPAKPETVTKPPVSKASANLPPKKPSIGSAGSVPSSKPSSASNSPTSVAAPLEQPTQRPSISPPTKAAPAPAKQAAVAQPAKPAVKPPVPKMSVDTKPAPKPTTQVAAAANTKPTNAAVKPAPAKPAVSQPVKAAAPSKALMTPAVESQKTLVNSGKRILKLSEKENVPENKAALWEKENQELDDLLSDSDDDTVQPTPLVSNKNKAKIIGNKARVAPTTVQQPTKQHPSAYLNTVQKKKQREQDLADIDELLDT